MENITESQNIITLKKVKIEKSSQPRPMSDYYLSQKNKQKEKLKKAQASKQNTKSLYEDALNRFKRQELILKFADEEAHQASSSYKPCSLSLKLSESKKNREIESALNNCESPSGFIRTEGMLKFFQDIDILLPANFQFKNIKAKLVYIKFENEILDQTWKFLNPNNEECFAKELLFDFVNIVFDKSLNKDQRVEVLERLKDCIEAKNKCEIRMDWTYKKIVNEFDKLSENKRVYVYQKQKEKIAEENKAKFEEEFQFKPNINEKDEEDRSENRYESLYKNYQEKEDKILCNKLTALEKELNECSFAPKILNTRHLSIKSEKKVSKITEKKTSFQSFIEKEQAECTFKPDISRNTPKFRSEKPRGYDEFIEKSKKIIEAKIEKKKREEPNYGENYEKFKLLKFNPPSFLERQEEKRNILLFIDVNVGPGKKGKIAIREGDDPQEVASNFCKIYSLGKDYQENLEEALNEQINDLTNNSN